MIRFSLLRFPITVHWFFWVNVALLGGAIGANTPRAMQILLGFMLAAFVSILVHELGHALVMRRFGDRRVEILLYAFGGVARGSRWLGRWEDLAVSAAGPLVQLAAGITVGTLVDPGAFEPLFLKSFFVSFYEVSLFWALLNLLPVLPLDGGHICRAFLGAVRARLALQISLACAAALALFFLQVGGMFPAVFFGLMAWNNWKELKGEPQVPWMLGR
jgi:stage IV sporulation protein FB